MRSILSGSVPARPGPDVDPVVDSNRRDRADVEAES
jgi:hypothetical protein